MASAPQPSDKALERLEREITCPVCQEYFDNPKVLPCLHYYCKKCIQALSLRTQPFYCPECRVATVLPQNDPEQLPTAFFVNRLKELICNMEKAHGEVKTLCEMCSGEISTAFCRQCTYFICDECVKCHRTMKVFVGHDVVSLDELKQGADCHSKQKVEQNLKPTCSVHVNEPFKLYCYECKCLICRDCVVIDHANHKFEFVRKVAAKARTGLEDTLVSLEEKQHQLSNSTKAVQVAKTNLVAHCKGSIDTIEKSFAQLHDLLENQKHVLITEMTKRMDEKVSKLDVQGKGFEDSSIVIQSVIDSVKKNIEQANDDELSVMHTDILHQNDAQMKAVCQGPLDYEPIESVPVEEARAITESLKEGCKSLAIQIGVFPTTCSVEPKAIEVNQPSQVILHVHSFSHTMERLHITLKSRCDGSPVPVTYTQKKDGKFTYQVSFMPIIRGRHKLEVRINDVPVAGSPLCVFVTVHPTQIQTPIMVISEKELHKPWGVTLNSLEEVLITDYFSDCVTAYDKNGKKLYSFKPVSDKDCLPQLCGIATDNYDNVYVADAGNNCIYKFNKDGNQVGKIGSSGTEQSKFMNPKGISVFKDQVFVCDYGNNRIQIFSTKLESVREFGTRGTGNGQFDYVRDIAHDELGNAYVCDWRNHRIPVFDEQLNFLYAFNKKGPTDHLKNPANICLSCDEFVYVTENDFNTRCCVSVFLKCGQFVTTFGEAGSELGQFNAPLGIACDSDGFLYVCDCKNSKVKVF